MIRTLKWLAAIINGGLFAVVAGVFIRDVPANDEILWVLAVLALLALNFVALILSRGPLKDDGLIGLYIESKKAKLRRQIDQDS